MKQLAVFEILRDACAFVWLERRGFLSLAFPGIVVIAILNTLFTLSAFNNTFGNTFAGLVGIAVDMAVQVMFAIAWHRRYLVPNEVTTVRAALRWGPRHTRFLLLAIGVWALAGASVFIFTFIVASLFGRLFGAVGSLFGPLFDAVWPIIDTPAVAGIIVAIPMLLIYARLSLLFPSTSVDHRMSFSECWRVTRGNGWRLALITILIAAPVLVILFLIDFIVMTLVLSGSLTVEFADIFLRTALWFIGIAAGVSALSISYRALLEAPSDAPPDEA